MNKETDNYDEYTGGYKCQKCGFWSTHPIPNHKCWIKGDNQSLISLIMSMAPVENKEMNEKDLL